MPEHHKHCYIHEGYLCSCDAWKTPTSMPPTDADEADR